MKNHHGGVIKYGPHLYGYSDQVGWTYLDFMSGEIVWNEKKESWQRSHRLCRQPVYCLGEGDGKVVLIEASQKGGSPRENSPFPSNEEKARERKSLDASCDRQWQDVFERPRTHSLL